MAGTVSREQKRIERRYAAKYRGDFAWRLLFEAVWGFAGWVGVIALAVSGVIPYWIACPVNGWFAYLAYMPLHEATHGNFSGRHGKLRWVDHTAGSISQIPLWFSYWAHRPSHMQHHAYTNEPARDPDHFVAGPFRALFVKFALLSFVMIAGPVLSLFPGGSKLLGGLLQPAGEGGAGAPQASAEELRSQRRFNLSCLAVFVALSLAGYFVEALVLWYLPSRIGTYIILVVFAWLPHHPHAERGRYRDTRVTLFPGSTLLIRGQDHHILHHMFPRVPHYRLPALFAEMRPHLEENGVRIEGSRAGPDAPPVLLRWEGPRTEASERG